jgi:hypothetical protein
MRCAPAAAASSKRGSRRVGGEPVLRLLEQSERVTEEIRRELTEESRLEQPLSSSVEGILDNAHIVQAQIADVRLNLPKKFYHELLVLTEVTESFSADRDFQRRHRREVRLAEPPRLVDLGEEDRQPQAASAPQRAHRVGKEHQQLGHRLLGARGATHPQLLLGQPAGH